MNILAVLAAILDNPAVQEPASVALAGVIKGAIPAEADKVIADFLSRVATHLMDPAVPVVVVPPVVARVS